MTNIVNNGLQLPLPTSCQACLTAQQEFDHHRVHATIECMPPLKYLVRVSAMTLHNIAGQQLNMDFRQPAAAVLILRSTSLTACSCMRPSGCWRRAQRRAWRGAHTLKHCMKQHQENAPPDEAGTNGLHSSKLACLLQVQGSKFTPVGLPSFLSWCQARLSMTSREPS